MHHIHSSNGMAMPRSRPSNWPSVLDLVWRSACIERWRRRRSFEWSIIQRWPKDIHRIWERDNNEGRPCHAMIHERLFVCCLLCLWLVWRVASGEAGKQKMGRFFCPKALTFTEESVLARFAASGLIWVALHFYYSPWYCHHNMKCMWFLLLLVYVFTCIVVSGVSFWNQRAKPKQPLHITRYYNNR